MSPPLSLTPAQESATLQVCFDLTRLFLSTHPIDELYLLPQLIEERCKTKENQDH
ncbi:hypothetical protein H6F89_14935 [Cyanobacteria bacterium FACHB-63]|nr:hypothetical protein [Cyanobacteria bacterium FACHB-63]